MHHGRHQRTDESRNDFIEEVALDAITVVYQGHGAELLELDIATKGGKQVILMAVLLRTWKFSMLQTCLMRGGTVRYASVCRVVRGSFPVKAS